MANTESLQIEIQAALCTLSEERLKEVCGGLKIILPPESKGRFRRMQAKYLSSLCLYFPLNTLIYLNKRLFLYFLKYRLVFKLPLGGNLYSS